jgi:nucleosome binding factor SPN SPT16 subunit
MIEDPKKLAAFLKTCPGGGANVQQSFIDYPLGILIQSGDSYILNKFNVQSDSSKLQSETVYINVCGKFKEMHVMASRTLLVNPKDDQKKAYLLAFEALDLLAKNLVPGKPIKNAYIAAKEYIKEKDSHLASKLHNNFGFGVNLSSMIYVLIDWL